MNVDKYTKILLTMITLGLWMTVLKPSVSPTPVFAQSKKQYEYLTRSGQKLNIGGQGSEYLAREDATEAMNMAAGKGWRVVDVNMFQDFSNRAFYTIVVEK